MPAKGIHHVDLAVAELERSLAFRLTVLEPLGWREEVRYPTYRGTEEVVYLKTRTPGRCSDYAPPAVSIGIRVSGLSTWPSRSRVGPRSTQPMSAASAPGPGSISRPKRTVM
jgi:catechol 2,3-dioxygenase-like lactoylglutathione lyase family enzyme